MKTLARIVSVVACVASASSVGCGAKHPHATDGTGKLPGALASAFREEAAGDAERAVQAWLAALETAVETPDDPWSVDAALTALDALAYRRIDALDTVAAASALSERLDTRGLGSLEQRLGELASRARGPFGAALIAEARTTLAERRGDAAQAEALRKQAGCATGALVFGPLAWSSVSAVSDPGLFDAASGPVPSAVPGAGPFSSPLTPKRTAAAGCEIPLDAETGSAGVRELAVDAEVPKGGWIGVGLHASSPARLRVGGLVAIDRGASAGAVRTMHFARIRVAPGTIRLALRAGMTEGRETIRLGAWDAEGKPLALRTPSEGEHASAKAMEVARVAPPKTVTPDEGLASGLARLARHEVRAAEEILEPLIARKNAPPEALLAYSRAVRHAPDLPRVKAEERARSALGRVLEAAPHWWEATLEHAALAGSRRAPPEARLESLRELAEANHAQANPKREAGTSCSWAWVDAYEALLAGEDGLYDRALPALARSERRLPESRLLHEVRRAAEPRAGAEAAAFDCEAKRPTNRNSLACYQARVAASDRSGAEAELVRLRRLRASPQLHLSLSARSALESDRIAQAKSFQDAMNPGNRSLSTQFGILAPPSGGLPGQESLPALLALAPSSRDAPAVLAGLFRAVGEDPLRAYEGVAERVTGVGQPTYGRPPSMADSDAATVVLAHEERYAIAPNGVAHVVMLDVRRVVGTADVASNAQAATPVLYGKTAARWLRRRIFKRDGRILMPERTPMAAQADADLSQLEAGDAIEAVYEAFALPDADGQLGFDTPDLLPERTSARQARIEVRYPARLRPAQWSHASLGQPVERTEGDERVMTWSATSLPIRRFESGTPTMDRGVLVAWSTSTWNDTATGLRNNLASLGASLGPALGASRGPGGSEVATWAEHVSRVAGGESSPRAKVEAVVTASGQAVREASGSLLANTDVGNPSGPRASARTVLATHEGSRTWLVVQALASLGIRSDVVLAENEPFSDSASFPPHAGRFVHPLAVAHVGADDVWIDADVPGPPLPAGRISPELRGRSALRADGSIVPLPPSTGGRERDEFDIPLALDAAGNSKGIITVLLQGRSAQEVAEALERIVGQERQRALRGIALGWVPFATVEAVELSSTEGSWQVAIRAEFSAPSYAQPQGAKATASWTLPGLDPIHAVFPRAFVSTLGATYAKTGVRQGALAVNHAIQYHVRRRVELPSGATLMRVPGPVDARSPLVSARRALTVTGSAVEDDFVLDVSTGTIPLDRYMQFEATVRAADDGFRASTQVRPPR